MSTIPTIRVAPGKVALFLGALVALVLLLGLPAPIFRHVLGHDYVRGFLPFAEQAFDLNEESNVPTWLGSVLLLLCSIALLGVGLAERTLGRRYANHWLGLAAIFVVLSLDETATFHERAGWALRQMFDLSGALYFGWVTIGAAFVLVVGLLYLRFLWHLPSRTRSLFILAGVVFVGGALGLELVQGNYADIWGDEVYGRSVTRILLTYTEEVMEMAGCVILIYGALDYHRRQIGPVQLAATGVGTAGIEQGGARAWGAPQSTGDRPRGPTPRRRRGDGRSPAGSTPMPSNDGGRD